MHPDEFKKQDNYELFVQRYARGRSAATRELERRVLGHDARVNGYTTVEQADALTARLELRPHQHLLDLGAGRGWPGSRIAAASSAVLISTDVPREGLRIAIADGAGAPADLRHYAVAADGRALPFASASVDAAVHADVFC